MEKGKRTVRYTDSTNLGKKVVSSRTPNGEVVMAALTKGGQLFTSLDLIISGRRRGER